MSAWIDFAVYAMQGVLFWVFLPRQGWRFGTPTIVDRNPDWLATHPEMSRYLSVSTGFLRVWYAWAAISIVILLAVLLGWRPFGGTDPTWEVLKDWHGRLLMLGVAGWFASAGLWFLWLKRNVPLADRRSATLHPRTTAEYLSLPWRVTVETLSILHLAIWVAVGFASPDLVPDYWAKFAGMVAMTVVLAAVAWWTPRRRPGYPDRIFGESFRRVELRVCYLLRLTPLVAGAMVFGEALTGVDLARVGHLALVLLVSALIAVFLFMRPIAPVAGEPPKPPAARGRTGMIGSPFGSTIHDSPRAP
jgi:hypothetical protein